MITMCGHRFSYLHNLHEKYARFLLKQSDLQKTTEIRSRLTATVNKSNISINVLMQ